MFKRFAETIVPDLAIGLDAIRSGNLWHGCRALSMSQAAVAMRTPVTALHIHGLCGSLASRSLRPSVLARIITPCIHGVRLTSSCSVSFDSQRLPLPAQSAILQPFPTFAFRRLDCPPFPRRFLMTTGHAYARHFDSDSDEDTKLRASSPNAEETQKTHQHTPQHPPRHHVIPPTVPLRPRHHQHDSDDRDIHRKDLPLYQRFKTLLRKYGKTAFFIYIGLGTITLTTCYVAVSQGLDVKAMMESIGITSGPWLNETSGTFVIAYFLHKLLFPVRIAVTIAITPTIAKKYGLTGVGRPHSKHRDD